MVDFSFTTLENAITMNDVIVTLCAFLAGWTKFSQGEKDRQLRARDDTIAYLEGELKKLRSRDERDH